ncbi:YqhG family protein [Brevibacillus choshinensis]|uniref:YqhG family protein n=1 Tax=Brevibacillus choshinensis TaxID=54911 RepID=UPI002E1A4207|nr:YqhG family protein [Brevibacillus choshinensis]MED4783367.1 YqhG family protein [Brevibacillus choshinensis]
MQQEQVRQFVERYLASFSAHIVESHPDYLTVKLPVDVDKDIGNRPFYWSWVEKMNIAYQPLVLTFAFHPDRIPDGLRAEYVHLGAARMQQIFESTKKHGRFLCMYEQKTGVPSASRRSTPLVPWLGLNLKVSLLCDKKRDILLYLGINLHNPRVVHDFTSFLFRLPLSPTIPDYFYTTDRRITVPQALAMAEQEVTNVLKLEDQTWAEEARSRLQEELDILAAYYEELARREPESAEKDAEDGAKEEESIEDDPLEEQSTTVLDPAVQPTASAVAVEQPQSFDEYRATGGRILDFLRANGIQVTPKEEINQKEWRKSTPDEERQRRMDELRWQHEPRIDVQFINGGLFYLSSTPPLVSTSQQKNTSKSPVSGRIL